jgi:uncharacterized repeat protein (TIGR03803 family)
VFNASKEGSYPEAGLTVASDGLLYGITRLGAAYNKGTIFKFNPSTNQLTVLHVFSGSNGAEPRAELTEGSDGRLYGTTSAGGSAGIGTVFSIGKSGGFSLVASFKGSNGRLPFGKLVQANGDWWGTTAQGGASSMGVVFRVDGGTVIVEHSFSGADGANPRGGLVRASDGNFYGTTAGGGASNKGTFFKINTAGTLTTLRSFAGSNGQNPYAELVQANDGKFYGTTMFGGASSMGVIFRADTAGNLTVLRSLSTNDGGRPEGALLEGFNGRLYGVSPTGGPEGSAGTVFELTTAGGFTRLATFNGTPSTPYAPLHLGKDGALYGVSYRGGTGNLGTIYRFKPGIAFDVLHGFSGSADGGSPYDGVTQTSDGTMFGAAGTGGASNAGATFKYSMSGGFSMLSSFSSNTGIVPYGNPVAFADGYLYGVTSTGGASQAGTIYRMTTSGALTPVHHFNGTSHGKTPYGRLLHANGLIYGTTSSGGSNSGGTLFSYHPATDTFRILRAFAGPDGKNPYAGLAKGGDGRLYGVTYGGGKFGYGVIFAFDPDSESFTTLFSFASTNGAHPYGTLLDGGDGRLYGTTAYGGASNRGTVFSVAKNGTGFTVLHSFNGSNGSYPRAGLVEGSDGKLYGTTPFGGSANSGLIYSIAAGGGTSEPPPPPPPPPPSGDGTIFVSVANSDASWAIGSTRTIKWNHTFGVATAFKIEVTRDGGTTWTVIAASVTSGTKEGAKSWLVLGPTTTRARVRVSTLDGSVRDVNNADIRVYQP